MKLTAVGDVLIQKRISESYRGSDIMAYIAKGDARFFNLETTINEEGECFASQFSGGTYIRVGRKVFDDVGKFGFNLTSFNNNHVLDFSYDGLYSTLQTVDQSGLVHAGVGYDLAQASAPKYLKTPNGTVALISVNTTFDPSMMAGKKTSRVKGRPGINGLRTEITYQVSPEELNLIRELARKTGANSTRELDIREGYALPDAEGIARFGALQFAQGDRDCRITTICHEDLDRVRQAIEEAKSAAEVLISLHTHQIEGEKEDVPPFIESFARFCIDCGATAVIGHGPHLLRAIEVYREHPIFYSLGDFVLQLYDVEFAPADFYEKYGVDLNAPVYELLKKRSKNFTIGLMEDPRMSQTVIPFWQTENGKLTYLELLPVKLSMHGDPAHNGLPFVAQDTAFMDKLDSLSKPYGVRIVKENGKYICKWG